MLPANNIPLYIIPFWEIKNLQSSTDIFNDEFLPNDKFFQRRTLESTKKIDAPNTFFTLQQGKLR